MDGDIKVRVITPEVIGAVARPGDTILIGLADTLTEEELERLMEDFTGFTERTGIHIALVEQVTSMVVARSEGALGGVE